MKLYRVKHDQKTAVAADMAYKYILISTLPSVLISTVINMHTYINVHFVYLQACFWVLSMSTKYKYT